VGHRYGHHSRHSGYDGFSRYLRATPLQPPVSFRFIKWKKHRMLGWQIDQAIGAIVGRKYYAVGLLLSELATIPHAFLHRGAIYHFLFGDTDVWIVGKLRRAAGVRVIATFHEAEEGLVWMEIDRVVSALDAAVLVSESQRPYFDRLLPKERIFVVPHGMDTEFFCPSNAVTDEPVCITVGGHTRDFETLARAIDLVRQERSDARFIAVGTSHGHDGPPFEHPGVEFHHGISDEDLRRLYQTSRAAVFSFRQTTANNGTLEAMACGIPVVCTDIGGAREYLGSDGGILCPPGDAEAMAAGILRLFSDDALAKRMGAAGRERVLQFDFHRVAEAQAAVYAKISALR
jgi:glycosyltransferase involved in cell wall biosynthesis